MSSKVELHSISSLSIVKERTQEIDRYIQKIGAIIDGHNNKKRACVSVSELTRLNNEVDHLETLIRSLEIEISSIVRRKEAREFRSKAKEYRKCLIQFRKDAKWISAHAEGQVTRTESAEWNASQLLRNEDTAISYGQRLQDDTEQAADRALKDLEDTRFVAVETAITVHDQTKQIQKMDENLAEIESEMERASKTIKRLARRILTDKYVNCLLIVILLVIVVIVVLHFVDFRKPIHKQNIHI